MRRILREETTISQDQRVDTTTGKFALDLFSALEDASQSMFYVIQDGRFAWGNRKGCSITGLDSINDVIGKPALAFVHQNDKPVLTEMSRKAMQGDNVQPFEWRLRTVDGQVVWVLGLLMKIRFKGRPALLGNYIDITDAKLTQAELQRTYKKLEDLTFDLKSVRQEERAQIAYEIQDNLSHTLSNLKEGIEGISTGKTLDDREKQILIHRVDSALESLAGISAKLNPPDTDHLELFSAMRWLTNEFKERKSAVFNLQLPRNQLQLGEKQTRTIYRIFQETLDTLFNLCPFQQLDITLKKNRSRLNLKITGRMEGTAKKKDIGKIRLLFQPLTSRLKDWDGDLTIEKKGSQLDLTILFNLDVSPAAREIRILLGCSQPILKEGIGHLLDGQPEIAISRHIETWFELTEEVGRPDFDVLLLDTALLRGQITDNLKKLKGISPFLPILVFHSTGKDDDLAVQLFRHGASGYLSQFSSANELVSAIYKAASGRKHVNNRIAEKLAFDVDMYSSKPFHHRLSERERQIMFMIAEGKTLKEIAADLCLSYKTIITYRNRVFEKMGMSSNTEIIRYIVTKGLI